MTRSQRKGCNSMGKGVLVFLLLASPVAVHAQNIGGPPYIAVHGQAKVEVVPDLFPLTVTLTETGKDGPASQARIESLARRYLDLAEAEGMQDADITVGNLDISPNTEYDEASEKEVFLGNTYEREFKFRFHSLEALRTFISKAPVGKQVRLRTDSFAYSGSDDERRKLLRQAIEDARATADDMAKGIGMTIAGVQTISNSGFNIRYSDSSGAMSLGAVTVNGSRLLPPQVVLKRGRITLAQDVYIIYLLGN